MVESVDGARAFTSARAWRTWLERNHDRVDHVWMKIAKKGTGTTTVTYPEAVEVALCFGWIDGQSKKFDDVYSLQRFTPRRSRSPWSRINRDRAEALIASGAMRDSGMREVQRAQSDGRWDSAYEPPSRATVPDDLARALDVVPSAKAFFKNLDGRNRYAILYRIQDAKRAETRTRRIEQFVAMLANGETIYPTRSGRTTK